MLPTLVGLRCAEGCDILKGRIPRGTSGEGEDLEDRGHTEPTWPGPISLMANKVQRFSQSPTNTCPRTELLLEHSELLFLIFFNIFSFLQHSKRGAKKEGRQVKRKWCRQRTGTGLWGDLEIRLETVSIPVSISVWLCRAIHLPLLTPAWSESSAPLTHLSCYNLETSESESRS